MSVTFDLLISVQSLSNPCFICQISWFLRRNISSIFYCVDNICSQVLIDCLRYLDNYIMRVMHEQGGGWGSCRWRKRLRRCAHKIIIAKILLRQAEDWSWFPVRILVPQGTLEASSTDHMGVKPCDLDWYPVVDPTTYVWNRWIMPHHFRVSFSCYGVKLSSLRVCGF